MGVDPVREKPPPRRGQSGLGMQLAEELVLKHGSRVEPITMTAPVKESLASRILAVFQCGDVGIPDHRPLIDDLHSIQRTVTLSGNVRYAAPREAGSHADRWHRNWPCGALLHFDGDPPCCTSRVLDAAAFVFIPLLDRLLH